MYALNSQQQYWSLLKIACRRNWQSFRAMLWVLLLIVLIKDLGLVYAQDISNTGVSVAVKLCCYLLMLYLSCCGLMISHQVLQYKNVDYHSIFITAIRRFFHVSIVTVILPVSILLVIGIVYRGIGIFIPGLGLTMGTGSAWFLLSLFSTIVIYQMLLVVFSIPLTLIYKKSIWQSLMVSIRMSGRYLHRLLVLYTIAVLLYFSIAHNTRHSIWLRHHYINIPVDFIIISILLPMLFNMIMVIFEDLRIRYQRLEEDDG